MILPSLALSLFPMMFRASAVLDFQSTPCCLGTMVAWYLVKLILVIKRARYWMPISWKNLCNDVSGSTRQLIASGCASFYNSEAFSGRVPSLIRERGLPHTPAYSYDFRQSSGSHTSENPTDQPMAVFSGTIKIEMENQLIFKRIVGTTSIYKEKFAEPSPPR